MVGRGVTVGRPLGLLLTRRAVNATVTLCHTGTKDVAEHMRRADVVVAAAGVPGVITAAMVKPGAAVLDVGITRVARRRRPAGPGWSATSRRTCARSPPGSRRCPAASAR